MSEAAIARHIGDAGAYQEERREARFSRRFRTALPIVIANNDLEDLGAGQGLGLGLLLGLGIWALIGRALWALVS